MGQAKKKMSHRYSPIRRLFFKRDLYICGMCRRSYEEKIEGERCLSSCSKNFALKNGVAMIRHMGSPHYKCRYCRRLYPDLELAQDCVAQCVPEYWRQIGEVEVDIDAPKLKERKRYVAKPPTIKIKPIPPYKLRNMISDEELDREIEASINESENSENQEGADGNAGTEKKKAVRLKADLPGEFIRQGAQYQCTFCMELYYTKVEVTKCFAAHPDELPEDRS